MKRRILYFYRMAWPDGRAHSIQIARTTAALALRGAAVTLYVRRGEVPPGEGARRLGLHDVEGLRIVRLRWRRDARWPLAWRLSGWRLISSPARAPVVYLRQIERYSLAIARIARRLGLPYLYEAHNIKCAIVEESEGRQQAGPWEAIEREIFQGAAGIVFTAPLTEPLARERFGFTAPSLLAPNAASAAPDPSPVTSPSAASEVSPERDIDVLYVGQLYAWKGIELLLRTMARIPSRVLTVAGGVREEDLRRARTLAEELGVASQVRFLGQLPPAEVASLMSRARVGVIPLPAEGSIEARLFTAPLKLFEFWAAGTPVVATDLPSLRALVEDGETGLLTPAEPEAFAQAIERLIVDRALGARLGEAGRRRAASYTWDDRATAILDFIERVVR